MNPTWRTFPSRAWAAQPGNDLRDERALECLEALLDPGRNCLNINI